MLIMKMIRNTKENDQKKGVSPLPTWLLLHSAYGVF